MLVVIAPSMTVSDIVALAAFSVLPSLPEREAHRLVKVRFVWPNNTDKVLPDVISASAVASTNAAVVLDASPVLFIYFPSLWLLV